MLSASLNKTFPPISSYAPRRYDHSAVRSNYKYSYILFTKQTATSRISLIAVSSSCYITILLYTVWLLPVFPNRVKSTFFTATIMTSASCVGFSISFVFDSRKEGDVLFNDTLTHCYMESHTRWRIMLPSLRGLPFPISNKECFICTVPQIE